MRASQPKGKPGMTSSGTTSKHRAAAATGVLLLALLAAGCSKMEEVRGYLPDDQLVGEVKPGLTSRADVASKLGSPTTATSIREETWYYISQRTERFAFMAEETIDRQVLAISFGRDGVVTDVRRFTLEDGQEVAFNERVTPTRGREMTVLEQFFGNIGRFSKQEERRR